jgi:hypothetical protein
MKVKSELERWDPVTGLVRVSLVGCKILLILISLGIVLWQGYDVTQTYLSKPISTEVKVVPLSSIPNIRLSICMKFIISDCLLCKGQSLSPFKKSFSANYQDYWNNTDLNKTSTTSNNFFSIRNILDQIQYWNDSGTKWEMLFDRYTTTIGDEMALFTRQMYPYVDNFTLLCHTLNLDIETIVPLLQLQRKGKESISFHSYQQATARRPNYTFNMYNIFQIILRTCCTFSFTMLASS